MKTIEISKTEFEDLLSYQCTKEDIAGFFHVSEKTIARFCQREYQKTFKELADEYNASGRVSLRRAQYASALAGNVQMQIFLGKQWLGQSDKITQDVTQDVSLKANGSGVIIQYEHRSLNEPDSDPADPEDDDDQDQADIDPEDFAITVDEETEKTISEKVKKLVFGNVIRKKIKDNETRIIMSIGMKSLMVIRSYFLSKVGSEQPIFVHWMISMDRKLSDKYDIDYTKGNGCSCSEHFHAVPCNRQPCTLCQSNVKLSDKCTWEHAISLVCSCDPDIRNLAELYRQNDLVRSELDLFIDKEIDDDDAYSFRNILQKARFVTDEEMKELTEAADSFS